MVDRFFISSTAGTRAVLGAVALFELGGCRKESRSVLQCSGVVRPVIITRLSSISNFVFLC